MIEVFVAIVLGALTPIYVMLIQLNNKVTRLEMKYHYLYNLLDFYNGSIEKRQERARRDPGKRTG